MESRDRDRGETGFVGGKRRKTRGKKKKIDSARKWMKSFSKEMLDEGGRCYAMLGLAEGLQAALTEDDSP